MNSGTIADFQGDLNERECIFNHAGVMRLQFNFIAVLITDELTYIKSSLDLMVQNILDLSLDLCLRAQASVWAFMFFTVHCTVCAVDEFCSGRCAIVRCKTNAGAD